MVDIVNEDGEIISPEDVEYAYTREGRRTVGKEFPNPVPVEAPIGYQPHEPVWEMIRRMVLDHARREKEGEVGEEMETEAEANDFDVGDDYDPSSPYEESHEPEHPWPMSKAAAEMETAINELRNGKRIETLKAELAALQEGREWPPVAPATPPAQPASPKPDTPGSP